MLGTQVSGKEVIMGQETSNVSNKDHNAIDEGWQGKLTRVCPAGILLSNQKKQRVTARHSLDQSQWHFAK